MNVPPLSGIVETRKVKLVDKERSKGKRFERAGRKAENLNPPKDVDGQGGRATGGENPVKSVNNTNTRFFGINAVLAMMLATFLFCGTASAASKSTTVQVSCTVKPMMEMASSAMAARANTNLGKQFQMSESLIDRGSQKIKVYSLTAL